MLKNYFKLAYRNLRSNKLVSFINIFGLSIAIGCCITVFLFLQNNWTMDRFHENGEHIFIAEYTIEKEGVEQTWGSTPMPLATALAADFPQVERAVRVDLKGAKVYLGDKVFDELVYFADPDYFDLFTFPLQSGNAQVLSEPDAVVLSAAMAEKYFKDEIAIGKNITVVFDTQIRKVFTVQAVAEDFPNNIGFKFDLLTSFSNLQTLGLSNTNDWANHTHGTFIQLRQPEDAIFVETQMKQYITRQHAANEDIQIESFVLDNLRHPNAQAYEVFQRPAETTHPIMILIFSMIALLMMALSCFNYINIALGLAGKRLKEIGIRKVIGGKKKQLIVQFMTENLLLCFLALFIGLLLTYYVFAPFLNSIMVTQISVSLSANPVLWVFLVGLLLLTGLASGAYPAFYISSFQTVSIFRGKQQLKGNKKLTKVLTSLQFVLAFSIVILCIFTISAGNYWATLPWGYQAEQSMIVRLDQADQFEYLKNEAQQNTDVLLIAGAENHVGESMQRTNIWLQNTQHEVVQYQVGAGYLEAMGLRLEKGRFFNSKQSTVDAKTVVVNQYFAEQYVSGEVIGQQMREGGETYTIVGVVHDFKMMGSGAALPVVFYPSTASNFNYLVVQHRAGKSSSIENFLQTAWKSRYPDAPFNFIHQQKVFEQFYRNFSQVTTAFFYLAILALFIACLGLFGLAAQNFAARLKEVSIRKVLGASVAQIVLLANKGFLIMLLISSILATTGCYFAVELILESTKEFTGEVHLGVFPYLIANALVFFTAALAVGSQTYQLIRISPVKALQNE